MQVRARVWNYVRLFPETVEVCHWKRCLKVLCIY